MKLNFLYFFLALGVLLSLCKSAIASDSGAVLGLSSKVSEQEIIISITNNSSREIMIPTFRSRVILGFWILDSTKGASFTPQQYANIIQDGGFAPSLFSNRSLSPKETLNVTYRFDELSLDSDHAETFRFLLEPHSRRRIFAELSFTESDITKQIFQLIWEKID